MRDRMTISATCLRRHPIDAATANLACPRHTSPHKANAIHRFGVSATILAGWLLGANTLAAMDASGEAVSVKLINSLVPGRAVELTVPKEYVSSRNVAELRDGMSDTESLYLVFRYDPQSEKLVSPASPRDLLRGTPGLTHLFLSIPYRAASDDIGRWYLDTFIRDAKRAQTYRNPEQIAPGVVRYDFSGSQGEIVYAYKDAHSKTVAVKCSVVICRGYKTWNVVVHVSYWYERTSSEFPIAHPREIDALIEQLLPGAKS